jgi:putative ABC transport system ATP-binding protein
VSTPDCRRAPIIANAVEERVRDTQWRFSAMTDVVLRAESLSKSYVDGGVRAVDGIELTVRAGEFVNIMGSSGSGKTTLLYLLAGLERPSGGSVWVEQNRIDELGAKELARLRRHSIGFVFQSMNLLPHLSLRENILVAGYLTARPRSEVQLTADQLLQEMGIADAADRLPPQLFGLCRRARPAGGRQSRGDDRRDGHA